MNVQDFALDCVAAHRLTRLATDDSITRPLRARVIRWAYWRSRKLSLAGKTDAQVDEYPMNDEEEPPKIAELVRCRWCAGMWISGFVVVARRYAPGAWDPLARLLATSDAAALLARLEDG